MKEKFDISLYEGGNEACEVVLSLQKNGYTAFLAGGCVRDMLMGRLPKDFDIATNCTPEQSTKIFPHTKEVGRAFGVVLVRHKGFYFEIATFREDISYTDGRHPNKISFSNPEKDASRRDFTINAMFYDPVAQTLFDYVNGTQDLILKLIRFVGSADKRIKEDHLRMLRAIRFEHTLNFSLEPETKKAIQKNCRLVSKLSGERIRDELSRILCEAKYAGNALQELNSIGLLEHILPIFLKCPQDKIKTVYAILNNLSGKMNFELAMAIILQFINMHNHELQSINSILEHLRLSTIQKKYISDILVNIPLFDDFSDLPLNKKKILLAGSFFRDSLKLLEQRALFSIAAPENYQKAYDFMNINHNFKMPNKLLTGKDMIELGVKPGKLMGKMLQDLYTQQLNEKITTKKDAEKFVTDKLKANK